MSGSSSELLDVVPGNKPWPELEPPLTDLGDIDGDGKRDTIRVDLGSGGKTGALLVGADAHAPIYSLGGSSVPATVERFGKARAIVEDLDGDGVRDLVVGGENRESFAPGRVCVFSGKSGRLLALLGRKADAIERLPVERK